VSGFEIDGAVNVDALSPACLFDRELFSVELARDNVRLVIFQTQPMRQCDQPRTAFVNETELLFDPGADVARRARRRRADEDPQRVFLRGAQKARAPAHVKAGQAFNPALLEEFAPVANGVVVEKQRGGDVPTAPSVVQRHKCVGPSRHPRGRQPIPRQRDQLCAILFAKESPPIIPPSESLQPQNSRKFSQIFNEFGV